MPTVIVKDTSESTNSDAIELARQGCENLTVVWAHRQTSGRGQRGRSWTSVEGSVFWSVVLRPDQSWHRHTDIIYVMALAVFGTLDALTSAGSNLAMKWPNDTLLNGKKVGGTLTEASGTYSEGLPDWVVSGTGINVVPLPKDEITAYPASSLHQEGYQLVTRNDIIDLLLEKTIEEVGFWKSSGFSRVRERYLSCTHGLNTHQRIGVSVARGDYREGVYRGIDEEGAMILETSPGSCQVIHSGEVIRQA